MRSATFVAWAASLVGLAAAAGQFPATSISAGLSGAVEVRDANLPLYTIVGTGVPKPLTDKPGNPQDGRKWALGVAYGNCLACHKLPAPEEQFHGEIGPDLAGVGGRLPEDAIRLRIIDPKRINPATPMPSFYKIDGLHRVAAAWVGKTILSAQQVEDVVAYLKSLR